MQVTMATSPSRPEGPNEDFTAALPHAAVLLDGAGIPVNDSCAHGVAWYTRRLGAALLAGLAADDHQELTAILAAAIGEVRDLHADTCDVDSPDSPSATVVLLRLDGGRADYLVLADSVLLLDTADGEPVVICDERNATFAAQHRAAMIAASHGTPEQHRAHLAYIEAVRVHRNRPDGFWVAAAEPRAAYEALTGSVSVGDLRAVALLSDGAARLVTPFALIDWAGLAELLRQEHPAEIVTAVRAAEHYDRDGQRWPRAKLRDDATIAYCTRLGG
ncbi:Protein phosphatase 2C [Micromonospora pattaloongensis]|uniref:Protein phosphatase 2C n=1 Tax=Micromonospora pattaloongensis TaxID=405436 RepID=A0A1H3SVQ0_9ACTN|nr:protein phosphatase 2C domain-containing protein [Micromonospora pattaloongensis]SDZ41728.1 Protein phosphatase 2C [Micromonospora pattaloongensis]